MKKFKIGLQLYSIRWQMEENMEETLKKVKEMGYECVEFAGYFGRSAEEIRAMLDKYGLECVSVHLSSDVFLKDMEKEAQYMKTLGAKYYAIPWLNVENYKDEELYKKLIGNIKEMSAVLKKYGIQLCYHNHDFEFEKVDGEYKLDRLYSDVPADLLSTQFDTCWVNVGGENPSNYIRKYNGRIEIIHLKDFVGSKSENMYGLIGAEGKEKGKDTSNKFELRPVGSGVQDFPAILAASKEVGAKWVVVEQDEPSMGKNRLECAEVSINYLKSIF